jgi:hypothetical protein
MLKDDRCPRLEIYVVGWERIRKPELIGRRGSAITECSFASKTMSQIRIGYGVPGKLKCQGVKICLLQPRNWVLTKVGLLLME